jgi:glycosyltransferase involved in cell wall biosynthesis
LPNSTDKKLPISVMVVGYNEAHLLDACLQSLYFCDEILYADLQSKDESIEKAKQYGASIFIKEKVPSCEYVQAELINHTKNDWVIFIDPDEVVDSTLAQQIINRFSDFAQQDKLGAVMVPWHFYFKKHKLKGTIWGADNYKYFLVNKNRFHFKPITHYGRDIMQGFDIFKIPLNADKKNILHHYWMNDYQVFLAKHQRYLKKEGVDEYNRGRRVGLKQLFVRPFVSFNECFIAYKGYRDGLIGFTLSLFWAYYKTQVAFAIRMVQKEKLQNGTN